MWRVAFTGFCLSSGIALAQTAPASRTAMEECRATSSSDVIAGLGEGSEVRLGGGRTLKLLDIRLPTEGGPRPSALAWLSTLTGAKVHVSAVGQPDRWGRTAGSLTLEDGAIEVADLLVAEGFALVSSEERNALCRPELLALESRARAQRRGMWSDPGAAPVWAGDLPALQQRVGRFVLVEGEVRSVGERASRTYLNFGAFGAEGFTVTIPKRTWSSLRAQGISAQNLRRRRVRVRGLAEAWRGVAMEITVPAMLEVLADKRPE